MADADGQGESWPTPSPWGCRLPTPSTAHSQWPGEWAAERPRLGETWRLSQSLPLKTLTEDTPRAEPFRFLLAVRWAGAVTTCCHRVGSHSCWPLISPVSCMTRDILVIAFFQQFVKARAAPPLDETHFTSLSLSGARALHGKKIYCIRQ